MSYRELVREARKKLRAAPCQSPETLSKALLCSPRTLNRAFEVAGSTVRDERAKLRLDRAASVLLKGKRPAEAARQAQYASPRRLAEPFRERFGVTPSRMSEIGEAMRTVTWQAEQPGPYRGSWQQRQRRAVWRAQRRVLRNALDELEAGTMPAKKVKGALAVRLPRPREPRAPLTLWEMVLPPADDSGESMPDDVRRQYGTFFRKAA